MKLSAAMMVKDGGELFRQTLDSIAPFIDELVLVNTDDAPLTADVLAAKALPPSVEVKVLHSPWQQDFSHHRNESLAPCTGDWVLIIDADEELTGGAALRGFLQDQPQAVHSVSLELWDLRQGQCVMRTEQRRLFRPGQVHYTGRVHNQPQVEGGENAFCSAAHLKHYGYGLEPEAMAQKIKRSQELLDLEVAEGKVLAFYYRAQQKGMAGEVDGALADITEYLEQCSQQNLEPRPDAFYSAITSCLKLKRIDAAANWLDRALNTAPNHPDIQFLRSELGHQQHNPYECVEGATLYLNLRQQALGQPGAAFHYTLSDEHYAIALYRLIHLRGGEVQRSLEELNGLLPKLPAELASELHSGLNPQLEAIKAHSLEAAA